MKFISLIIFFLSFFFLNGSAQILYDANHKAVATITTDSIIENNAKAAIGYFKEGGRVENTYNVLLGKIKTNGTILDDHFTEVGYIKSDGRIQDARFSTIGYIKKDGTVQDGHHVIKGYAKGVKAEWVAAFFFFFRFQ